MTKSLRLLFRGHALGRLWLRDGCGHTTQMCSVEFPPTEPPSHQLQSVTSDKKSVVFNMRKKCDAAFSKDFGHDTPNHLRHNDRTMIRWICNVKALDEVISDILLSKHDIKDLGVVLHTCRMRWFGHEELPCNKWRFDFHSRSDAYRKVSAATTISTTQHIGLRQDCGDTAISQRLKIRDIDTREIMIYYG